MEKNLFDLLNEASSLLSSFADSSLNFDDKSNMKSYYYKRDEYENGEKVRHIEKEVKDGKVIKDVDTSKNIENKKEEAIENCEHSEDVDELKKEIKRLTEENEKLKEEYKRLDNDKMKLYKRNIDLEHSIKELETKLANIKSCLK